MLLKIAFVAGIVFVLALLVYRTLRPFLNLIRQFVQTVRHFQQVGAREPDPDAKRKGERLVQCVTCNTWIPQSRALAANSASYCSPECVKRAGVTRRRKRVS